MQLFVLEIIVSTIKLAPIVTNLIGCGKTDWYDFLLFLFVLRILSLWINLQKYIYTKID